MPWVRLDDRFPSHRKISLLSDRAFRLHVSALCWSSENLTEGLVPNENLTRIAHVRDMKATAKELEARGLWERVDDGWQIHDYLEYNPSRAAVQADRERNAARQQGFRDRKKAADAKKAAPDKIERNGVTPPVTEDPRNAVSNGAPSRPVPTTSSNEEVGERPQPEAADPQPIRVDVERACQTLADLIEANGCRRPTITKRWRDAARLMIDKDGRTLDEILGAIRWCQADEFWRSNVMAMPKLRAQYDRLRLEAQRKRNASSQLAATGTNGPALSGTDARVAEHYAVIAQMEAERNH